MIGIVDVGIECVYYDIVIDVNWIVFGFEIEVEFFFEILYFWFIWLVESCVWLNCEYVIW